jgi:hypothetical protein
MLKKLLIPAIGIVALAVLSGIALAGVPCTGTSTVIITEDSAPCVNAANICPGGDLDTLTVTVTVLDCYGNPVVGQNATVTPVGAGFVFRAADQSKVLVTDGSGVVSAKYYCFGGCGNLAFQAVCQGVTLGPSANIYIANLDNTTTAPTYKCDALDLSLFGQRYGSTTWACGNYNCSVDGKVDALDLSVLGQHYGHGNTMCP